MTPDPTTLRGIPPVRRCGRYHRGHDVHFIQARLSREEVGRDEQRTIRDVADDGAITFTDGTTVWNHNPERLRPVLMHCGNAVVLGSYGVLRVPKDGGAYLFSVCSEPDPCRRESADHRPDESMADELLRRDGFVRSGRSVLADLDEPEDTDPI